MSGAEPVVPGSGPKTRSLLAWREQAVPRGVANSFPLFVSSAAGAEIVDVDGRRYLDFSGGIGVMNVGHSHPDVVRSVTQQIELFTHSCFQVGMYEGYVAVADWLNRHTPGAFAKKTLLMNSGAEAVENAVKIARYATGRPAVIAFQNAFHGRTLFTLSLTGKVDPYKRGFGPFTPDVYHVPYPDPYRGPYGSGEGAVRGSLDALRRLIEADVPPDRVAAIIVEPVQGEGGFVVPPRGFLKALEGWCREHEILLIVDEVQTGFGRTGALFACEHEGVEPDLLVSAKSIAAGLPLSAVTGRAEIMDRPHSGALGGTYAGNPVACAAALAVFGLFEDGTLVARAREIGNRLSERLALLRDRFDLVGDIRSLGAMAAMELVEDRTTRKPADVETSRLLNEALHRGLIILKAGRYGNVVRFLAPLVISDAQLDEGLDIIERSLEVVSG